MLVYLSVVVVSVLRVVMCRAGSSLWPTPSPSWTPVAGRVLSEALSGPLSGYQVMLMVDDGVQRSLSLDVLMTGLTSPTIFLRITPQNTGDNIATLILDHGKIMVLHCMYDHEKRLEVNNFFQSSFLI